ncbi:MAG: diguanylate cyclase [Desulfobacterales bacterium]|nr:diguanylate cyclase [Desulfobacterales bacterium]
MAKQAENTITPDKMNILIVDDKMENILALEKFLRKPDLNILRATSGREALSLMGEHDFALVLLDVHMPRMDGFETAERMRGNAETRHIPIIFISDMRKERKHVFKAYESGAVDFLPKPVNPDILQRKVHIFLELYKQKAAMLTAINDLKNANRKILKQQKSVIEEERLKVLLQMAGATVHELSQPLTTLLGHIELIEMDREDPDEFVQHLGRIKEAGQRISSTVKKMQTIRHYETHREMDGAAVGVDQNVRILHVDASKDDFETIRTCLANDARIDLHHAVDANEAARILEKKYFDLIFLGYVLGDETTGMDFLEMMKTENFETPVVAISGERDEMIAAKMIRAGALDYLPKQNVSEELLLGVIMNTLNEASLKRDMIKAQARMAEMSTRDGLTGVFNRRYFDEALECEVSKARRYANDFALCLIDLDFFKKVNDLYGHPAGDKVLRKTGDLLKDNFRGSDLPCRYGGEEFAIILFNTKEKNAETICDRFRENVSEQIFQTDDKEFSVTLSIGVAPFDPAIVKSTQDLVVMADKALYQAKSAGRNRVIVYSQDHPHSGN